MRTERPLAAATAVYDEASGLYRQALVPLVAAAGAIALVFNVVLFVTPTYFLLSVPWGVLVNFLGVAMLAAAMIVPMAVGLRDGQQASGAPWQGVREHGVHIAIAAVLLTVLNAFLILTVIGLLAAVYLTVRLALYPVAAVVEDQDVTDSLARSWELVKGHWNRTAVLLLGAVSPQVGLLIVVAFVSLPWAVVAIVMALSEAFVVPYVVLVLVLLFFEYREHLPVKDDYDSQPPVR